MHYGVLFPQSEIETDPAALREWARAVVEYGFSHILTYEHVLGAIPERLPPDYAPYGIGHAFHEPFTLFGFLAAVAPELELVTGVLVLPQRPTALVAKQAAEVDHLTGGRHRLGVGIGWNQAEFEGLGASFPDRARRLEEQIEVLRLLWTQEVVDYQGAFHDVRGCGINPLPLQRPIPIWVGGSAESALRRAARLADGFFPQRPLEGGWPATLERMKHWRAEVGLAWEGFGIEPRVALNQGWEQEVDQWRAWGATHICVHTMGQGFRQAREHIRALGQTARKLEG